VNAPIRHGPKRGQALTEFALVIPIFLLVLYSIIEFGRYVYTVEVINDAAREGARYAITHGSLSLCPSGPMPGLGTNPCDPDGARVQAIVRKFAIGVGSGVSFPPQSGCAGGVSNPCWPVDNARGATVSVVAETTFKTLIPIVPLPVITVDGSSTLVVNH
jgi:hypothetical protein